MTHGSDGVVFVAPTTLFADAGRTRTKRYDNYRVSICFIVVYFTGTTCMLAVLVCKQQVELLMSRRSGHLLTQEVCLLQDCWLDMKPLVWCPEDTP